MGIIHPYMDMIMLYITYMCIDMYISIYGYIIIYRIHTEHNMSIIYRLLIYY